MARFRYLTSLSPLLILLFACGVSVGHQNLVLPEDVVANQYEAVRTVVVEEAANNGYGAAPTSEIKPSKYNNYKGKIYYALTTGAGTDQLTFTLDPAENGKVAVNINGGGTKGDPKGAIKAITERLQKLGATVQ